MIIYANVFLLYEMFKVISLILFNNHDSRKCIHSTSCAYSYAVVLSSVNHFTLVILFCFVIIMIMVCIGYFLIDYHPFGHIWINSKNSRLSIIMW